jgi:hypothetical protein
MQKVSDGVVLCGDVRVFGEASLEEAGGRCARKFLMLKKMVLKIMLNFLTDFETKWQIFVKLI